MNKDLKDFLVCYETEMTMSERQYCSMPAPAFHLDNTYSVHHLIHRENGIQLTLPKQRFEEMIADAESGREIRELRNRHPSVMQAWDQYRMLLALTARDEGKDLF